MELMAIIAMIASLSSLFLHGYTLGRMGGRHRLDPPGNTESEEERRAQERMQQGLDNIMGFSIPTRFAGDDR